MDWREAARQLVYDVPTQHRKGKSGAETHSLVHFLDMFVGQVSRMVLKPPNSATCVAHTAACLWDCFKPSIAHWIAR